MNKSSDPTKELKRELAEIKKKIAKLEKQLARNEKRTAVTCTSLEVVDSQGNHVASIDGQGQLDCASLGVGNGPPHDKPLKLGERSGSTFVKIRAQGDKESVSISARKGQGAVIQLSDNDGLGCMSVIAANSGTDVRLYDSSLGKIGVRIRAHDGGASSVGEIVTFGRKDNVTAWMPPKK